MPGVAALALTAAFGAWQLCAQQALAHHASKRFEPVADFADEAILDKETGLVWERRPSAISLTWTSARVACTEKVVAGRKQWRLPSLEEMRALVDDSRSNPALPAHHPFKGVLHFGYWTESEPTTGGDQAWAVSLSDATQWPQRKDTRGLAWCVRSSSAGRVSELKRKLAGQSAAERRP